MADTLLGLSRNTLTNAKTQTDRYHSISSQHRKIEDMSTLKLPYEEAVREYEYRKGTRLGTLVANRELPVLFRAKEIIDIMEYLRD